MNKHSNSSRNQFTFQKPVAITSPLKVSIAKSPHIATGVLNLLQLIKASKQRDLMLFRVLKACDLLDYGLQICYGKQKLLENMLQGCGRRKSCSKAEFVSCRG